MIKKRSPSFKNKNRHRKFSRSRPRNRSGSNTEGKVSPEKKYIHSLEQYCSARRKYFEFFHRAQGKKLDKLKKNFYRTLEELQNIEQGQKTKTNGEDLTYSQNHQLDPHPTQKNFENEAEIEPFYILESQKASNYSNDTEESVGTMDDYLSYKGSAQK